jgi:alpha-glucosidase (family GH31 glycosyl hydrolase)
MGAGSIVAVVLQSAAMFRWCAALAALAVPALAATLVLGGGCSSSKDTPPGGDAGADVVDPACLAFQKSDPVDIPDPPIHTPRWAFEPWLSKDYSSSDDTRAFVKESLARGIPVGVAVLDSPWETNYNTFVPDETAGRYANFDAMVSELTSENVKLVVWITQFENSLSFDIEIGSNTHYDTDNPTYDFGLSCGFFVNGGAEYGWYKGTGASVDFFNPAAVRWWRSLQDALLARNIAGYKIDFGDSYLTSDPVDTAAGSNAHQAYSEAYYKELYDYATTVKKGDFLTMVRGWDQSYGFAGRTYARPENAPVVWDGDNRHDWVGVVDALHTTFMNATLGYVVIGSDLGGYLDRDDQNLTAPPIPFDSLVFDRWVAMSALSPLMQLHSREDYMPWTIPDHTDETVALYTYWATFHHEIAPFFYSLAEESYAKSAPGIVRPVADSSAWAGDWRYTLGDAFLVAPLLDATGTRDVALPAGAKWYDWFAPAADAAAGGTTVKGYDATDRAKYPLFVREGAIVPMAVDRATVPVGTAASSTAWTVLAYPGATSTSFALHEEDDTTTTLSTVATTGALSFKADRAVKPLLVRLRADAGASAVKVNGAAASSVASFDALAASTGAAWFLETATRSAWVRVPAGASAVSVDVTSP